jgi:hypothetical protein
MDQGKENNSSCSGYHQCFIFFAFSDLLENDDFVFATFGFYLQRQTHTGGIYLWIIFSCSVLMNTFVWVGFSNGS